MSFWKKLFGGSETEKLRKAQELEERIQADKKGVRDKFKASKSFFEGQIVKLEERIAKSQQSMKKYILEEKSKGKIADTSMYFYGLCCDMLEVITAHYSKGTSIGEIKEECPALMETIIRFWRPMIDYTDGGTMNFMRLQNSLCLGILGEVSQQYFIEVSEVMQKKGFKDFIMDFWVNSQYPAHPISQDLLIKDDKAFNFFVKIIKEQDRIKVAEMLLQYLNKYYYTKQNLARDYNIHLYEEGKYYYGYWCWEVAALVKIRDIDDTLFKNHRYYPTDLVNDKINETSTKKNTFLMD